MTATTATPLAVRTGFCRSYGISGNLGDALQLVLARSLRFQLGEVERCAAVIRLHQLRHDMRDAQRVGRGPGICSVLSCWGRRRSASTCRVSSHD